MPVPLTKWNLVNLVCLAKNYVYVAYVNRFYKRDSTLSNNQIIFFAV